MRDAKKAAVWIGVSGFYFCDESSRFALIVLVGVNQLPNRSSADDEDSAFFSDRDVHGGDKIFRKDDVSFRNAVLVLILKNANTISFRAWIPFWWCVRVGFHHEDSIVRGDRHPDRRLNIRILCKQSEGESIVVELGEGLTLCHVET